MGGGLGLGDLRELAERLALGDEAAGPYITDGTGLYRIVGVDSYRNFIIEDCRSPAANPNHMTIGVITLYSLFRRVDPARHPA